MITNYENNNCRYRIERLDNVVFLLNKNGIGNISIDNGAAYVASAASLTSLECFNISLAEEEAIDERYEFTHSLQFSIHGYMNVEDLYAWHYVVVRDKDGSYWLLNPMFPCKITYTYTIGANESRTDFTFSTKSNYPLLRVNDFTQNYTEACKSYNLCGVDKLYVNESNFSSLSANNIRYTNDGFKVIQYKKNTCSFQETFDGTNVQHTLKFKIDFDSYKSSWHYNLLEFADNKYAMVLTTKCGFNVACGFNYGLNPSFNVTASNDEINSIEITLSDLHDQGTFVHLPSGTPFVEESAITWSWVTSEYDCIDSTTAKRTLMEKMDAYGNKLGKFKCLEGYQERYEYLGDNLVGTFNDVVTFANDACRYTDCIMQTSMPSEIVFTSTGSCKHFSLMCSTDFTISSDNYFVITPTSGEANTNYIVEICNFHTPTATASTHDIVVNYCDTEKTFYGTVVQASPSECLPQGQFYDISQAAQWVTIPVSCCISSVDADSFNVNNFQIQNGYIKFRIETNDTGNERIITLTLTKCDGSEVDLYISQNSFYSTWVKEGTQCDVDKLCDFERMYSGTTSTAITSPTLYTRLTNCVSSQTCADVNTRWVETTYTTCSNGKLYYVEFLQVYSNGTWQNTGQNRLGREIEDVEGQCALNIEHWIEVTGYTCNGTTKYTKERLYLEAYNGQPQQDWTPTDSYRRGSTVIEYNSEDCGYTPSTGYTYQEWRTEGWMCNGTDKYLRQRQYVSNDAVTWIATDVYQQGALIEQNSEDCGYIEEFDYQWVLTDLTQCGET